jgi:phosphomevalonate kinase
MGASAPGKALLCGEYAVLEGAPAVVSAVDRRASVAWSPRALPMPPEVAATLELARSRWGDVPGSLTLDVSALHREGVKLGLGSSAAAAAATAAAVFATRGHALDDPASLPRVFACAAEGHASVAPAGSGVDVAASVFGGFLRFTRAGDEVDMRPLRRPEELAICLVWSGHAARTSDLVAEVRRLRQRDPGRYERHLARLRELCVDFATAFETGRAPDVVACAAAYGEAMRALGGAAGAPIVESRLGRIAELAARFSGSAKPSGAGGGDVAVAFFASGEAAASFKRACQNERLHLIDVSWGAAGVRADGRERAAPC